MKTLQLLQNTEEWDKVREGKIGASDANIIMGVSEFCTPLELYNQKKGITQKKEQSFIQEKGHKKEVKARARFELIMDRDFPPLVAIHSDMDFLMASLDGYNEELSANWECKYVGAENFEKVKNGKMLDHYYPQVQMQLAVTGAKLCYFTCINDNDEIHTLEIVPDKKYIQEKLYPAIVEFWNKLNSEEKPELTEDDIVDMSTIEDLKILLSQYKHQESLLKEVEESVEKLKKSIFKMCSHPRVVCNGIKITVSKGDDKEVVDYERLVDELKLDTSKFMKIKKGITTKRITFPKENK